MKIVAALTTVVGLFALGSGDMLIAGIAFSAAMLFWLKSE